MSNSYYNHTSGIPVVLSTGSSAEIRNEFDLVETGFTNFESAVTTLDGLKAPKANPVFSTNAQVYGLTLGRGAAGQVSSIVFGAFPAASMTGADNISIGSGANSAQTAGEQNVAVGSQAVSQNGSGNGNTGVGYYALSGVSSGSYNTAVGNSAMANATGSAAQNVAVGRLAGYQISGSQNVAVGSGALAAAAMAGSSNAAVGTSALGTNTASNNTALGASALGANVTGTAVTAVGKDALLLSTGDSNTAIGYQAGSNITTGTNNTAIGNGAQAATAGTNNAITLGNSSVATLRCQVTSITSLSDARDKTAVRDLPHGLDFVNSLRPVEFTWNMRDGGKVGIRDAGFIAQELQAAQDAAGAAQALQLVYDENPEKLEATYGRLIPVLVKAIQDLSAQVKALQHERT